MLNLTSADFDSIVADSDVPVLVDFWAEWCHPCKQIAPILDEIAGETAGRLTVAKVNIDEHPDLAMRFAVMSVPTLLVFEGGELVESIVGAKSKSAMLGVLQPVLQPAA